VRNRLLLFFTILLFPLGAQAQRDAVVSGGIFGSAAQYTFSSGFTLPVAPPTNPYSDVSGVNLGFGIAGNWAPFLQSSSFFKNISFGLRMGYEPVTRTLESQNSTFTLISGNLQPITFIHTVGADFQTIPVDLGIYTSFLKNAALPDGLSFLKDMSLGLSPQFRILAGSRYTKTQRISDPNIDFLEGGNSRTEYDERLDSTNSVLYGFMPSLQLPIRLPQNSFLKDVIVKPEISYTFGFTDVSATLPWKISGLRAGISVEYAAVLAPKQFLKDTIILRDTTLQLVAFNAADTTILFKTDFRDSTAEDENFIYKTTFQQEFYTHFTLKPAPLLFGDMRVRFLKGGVETETISLMVEDSVVRRTIVTQDLTHYEYDTLHFTQFPRVIFYPEITSEAGISSWQVEVQQNGALLKTFRGAGVPPQTVEWDFSAESDPVKIARQPLDYTFSVTDREGQAAEIQRGRITFELEKKVNLPGAQLPVMREEFYFSKAISELMAVMPFKKRVLKTNKSRISVGAESEVATARLLAGILKISDKNIAVTQLPERFKNMIAVYLYP
jgi:hypothetical protein